jgi:hypothetical protein
LEVPLGWANRGDVPARTSNHTVVTSLVRSMGTADEKFMTGNITAKGM